MAIFSSTGSDQPPPKKQRQGEQGLSVVAGDMQFTGNLETTGVVKIEGTVKGDIRAEGQVLVAPGGTVEGNIYTREAIMSGEVRGNVFADSRVEVQATSVITGDIVTPKLVIQEGGRVDGLVKMTNPQALGEKGRSVNLVGGEKVGKPAGGAKQDAVA
ncbi:MAG: polymer-forming cytoskeletal protein [Gemmatimonadetes bacterium]|nr:polymer-forming cytoskeletal protein [Gemmatimonadota bacterium]